MTKEFVYIPSFSGGFFGNLLKKDYMLGGKLPIRFYRDDFPEEYKHDSFLVTAGHNYKTPDTSEQYGFDLNLSKNLIFGDSGGFQIATGAIKWEESLREKIFRWLEDNSNIAINLDIPPRATWAGRDEEALEISIENFKYFEKHQTGKTKFLNVIQGNSLEQRQKWYEKVKGFNFQGWALGGTGGSYSDFFDCLYLLILNKEHLNKNNYLFHFLGASTINEFSFYLQLQKSLNDIGCDVIITTDSSTPQRAVIWGTYYTEFNISSGTFGSIVFPNVKHQDKVLKNLKNKEWPQLCNLDKEINSVYNWDDYIADPLGVGNQAYMGAMTLHNFGIFKDAIKKLDSVINQDIYFRREIFKRDIFNMLRAIDEMVKHSNPTVVYEKFRPLFVKYSIKYGKSKIKEHDYF